MNTLNLAYEEDIGMKVSVLPHDPGWMRGFDAEANRIAAALGNNAVALHHIGSTAIPGIYAKPIIDVLLEVDYLTRLDEKSSALTGLGYEALGEFGIPGRRYFRKQGDDGVRTHHLHAFEAGSPAIERHLAFRDYMIAHPGEAQVYSALKQRLAMEHPDDMEAYMDGKDAYIKEQEAKAIRWRIGCMSETEDHHRPVEAAKDH